MKSWQTALLSASLLGIPGAAWSGENGAVAPGPFIEVMTQNQYVGGNLFAVVDPDQDFNVAVFDLLQTVAANLPAERARALALLIQRRQPALVGLQEVYDIACRDDVPGDHLGCENPAIAGAFTDHLTDTLAALRGRYTAVATVVNADLPADISPALPGIPVLIDGVITYITLTDRDVILARSDVAPSVQPVDFGPYCVRRSGQGCNYTTAASATLDIPLAGPVDVEFKRGYVAVDATVWGKRYRFVNTHLEVKEIQPPAGRLIQAAQTAELLQVVLGTLPAGRPLIVVGDMNSDPRDPFIPPNPLLPPPFNETGVPSPYQIFTTTGMTDVWTLRLARKWPWLSRSPDYTCCQLEDLSNPKSVLFERVDLIWSLPAPKRVLDARPLGDAPWEKTPPQRFGVWPSDHASFVALMQF